MNTAELINNLLDRADGSLDHLKLHYGPLIRYVITPILHDERDREEVFSDILIRVWEDRPIRPKERQLDELAVHHRPKCSH